MANWRRNIVIQKNPNAASWERYEVYPSFVLDFHGCDRSVGEAVLNGAIPHLEFSRNDYDWLGEGVYFWESSPARALDFARERARGGRNSRGNITEPFVVGAILNLRHCFITTEMNALNRLQETYTWKPTARRFRPTAKRCGRAASIARRST